MNDNPDPNCLHCKITTAIKQIISPTGEEKVDGDELAQAIANVLSDVLAAWACEPEVVGAYLASVMIGVQVKRAGLESHEGQTLQ